MGLGKIVVCWSWQKAMLEEFMVEQGLDVTIWDYKPKDLVDEIERRNAL